MCLLKCIACYEVPAQLTGWIWDLIWGEGGGTSDVCPVRDGGFQAALQMVICAHQLPLKKILTLSCWENEATNLV